jgi:bifunctional non-homologous end joining protein LigD
VIARLVVADLPDIATAARPLGERGGKVYVDFLQNGHGKTIAAPFSARPRPGAPVSLPLRWTQLSKRLSAAAFTIATAPALMRANGDPMLPVLSERTDVAAALAGLRERIT